MPKSSFRDPSGFLFERDGELFRQVNLCYKENYDLFMASGLYDSLVSEQLIIPHQEVNEPPQVKESFYKIIKPKKIPFISYPYEWSFSQLKDAALLTLKIQKIAIEKGMILKDASAYNIQYFEGKPILIDTLSFEKYSEGEPWVAYRQFCQHFLAPLALMSLKDIRLNQLLRVYLDGIPLDLASKLLPARTWLNLSLAANIHFHARAQKKHADSSPAGKGGSITKAGLLAIISSLEEVTQTLNYSCGKTEWGDYYKDIHYDSEDFATKKKVVSDLIRWAKPATVWDLGANEGVFSRIASSQGIFTVSIDNDPTAVEKNYLLMKENNEKTILPLMIDLTNPSGGLGWANEERRSFIDRGPADLVFALALMHHLVIGNNVSFNLLAEFMAKIGSSVIIEYVPKNDPQVKKLLLSRRDIFTDYNQNEFENAFGKLFELASKTKLPKSERTIYFMKKRV